MSKVLDRLMTDAHVLDTIEEFGGCTLDWIADVTGASESSVRKSLARLKAAGHVKYERGFRKYIPLTK